MDPTPVRNDYGATDGGSDDLGDAVRALRAWLRPGMTVSQVRLYPSPQFAEQRGVAPYARDGEGRLIHPTLVAVSRGNNTLALSGPSCGAADDASRCAHLMLRLMGAEVEPEVIRTAVRGLIVERGPEGMTVEELLPAPAGRN